MGKGLEGLHRSSMLAYIRVIYFAEASSASTFMGVIRAEPYLVPEQYMTMFNARAIHDHV